MLSNHLIWIKLISLFALLCSFQSQSAMTKLDIAPKTCVVVEHDTPCHMLLKVNYNLKQLEQTCIWLDNRDKPIQCFNQLDVVHFFDVTVTKDTLLTIKNQNDEVLQEITIQIATYQPISQRKRRGLHWNLL